MKSPYDFADTFKLSEFNIILNLCKIYLCATRSDPNN